jgi:hypothetical protein
MVDPVEMSARCHVCGEIKALIEFYADRTRPRGHGSRCKRCDDARDRTEHDARKYRRRKARQLAAREG